MIFHNVQITVMTFVSSKISTPMFCISFYVNDFPAMMIISVYISINLLSLHLRKWFSKLLTAVFFSSCVDMQMNG